MHIYWYGLSSFKIISKDTNIFTDPFIKEAGLTPPRGAGQIIISSRPDEQLYNHFSSISGDPFIIDGPGEYDVKGAFIRGIPAVIRKQNNDDKKITLSRQTIYSIQMEGLNLGFLGAFGEKQLADNQVEELNDIDILIVPVGGGVVCDAETAAFIVNQIEPRVVIPMHYKIPGLKLKLDPVEDFLKEMSGKGEEMDKLLIKKGDLEEEKTRLIVLQPQRS